MHRRSHLHLCVLVASLMLLASLSGPAAGAAPGALHSGRADGDNLDATCGSVRQQQADLAADLDVLRATSDEVSEALSTLDHNVASQREQTELAANAAVASRLAEATASDEVQRKEAEVEVLRQRLEAIGVSLYVRPPIDDAVHALVTSDPNQASLTFALARSRVDNVADVLNETKKARNELAAAQLAAATARVEAEHRESVQLARLAELQAARSQQQAFALDVSDRIERSLGEAAQLAQQDAALSAQILQRELELAARLSESLALAATTEIVVSNVPSTGAGAPVQVALPTTSAPPAAVPVTSPTPVSNDGTVATSPSPPPTNETTTTAAPTTTTTRAPVRTVSITPVATSWIRGIEVAAVIAPQFEAMLAAAEADGLVLTGSGYRNILDQIQIRREVCGPTDYDIFVKPSWECSPPVAIPGRSMHEKGLAIDFSGANGDLIRTRDHPVFIWLAANAWRFGFINLPSEPWHWSTTGG